MVMSTSRKRAGEEEKQAFAHRLRQAIRAAGFETEADFARACALHVPPGMKFERQVVSNYTRAKSLPTRRNLDIMATVLKISPTDLLAPDRVLSSDEVAALVGTYSAPARSENEISFVTLTDGTSRLSINKVVPTAIALKILALLTEAA